MQIDATQSIKSRKIDSEHFISLGTRENVPGVTAPSEKEDKTDKSPGWSHRETKRPLLRCSDDRVREYETLLSYGRKDIVR